MYDSPREGADSIHSSTGDITQGPASRFIQVGMVGMRLHGRDNGGDTAGNRDGDFVRIIYCEVRVRVGVGVGAG